jgi:ferredoxin-NADP reductase/Na+-translocating ferredoxin:NAD+ oxidoreductase RnfD subunit
MYRLLVYGLSVLLAGAIVLSLTHRIYTPATAILASSAVILTVGYVADRLLSIIFKTYTNNDSSLITCLILCCILPPSTALHSLALVGVGALIAIGSKFLIVRHRKHIFNPAAFAALILGVSALLPATWWIGSPGMLPLTIIFGLLVLRKVRKFQLFGAFLVGSLVVAILLGLHHDETMAVILKTAIESSPLVFLGTVMLTEPSTTPPVLPMQLIYGLIVGAIFTSQLSFGRISATPEVALIIGNLYAYAVSPKYKLRLQLKRIERLAPLIYDFSFAGSNGFAFRPGQYLEWTLPRSSADSRGNRRTFSIASAPSDEEIHIAIKVPDSSRPTSKFKKTLTEMKPGNVILAGQLAGDFVLPKNVDQKLVFVAGGIGITPFLSMVKDMIKTGQKRDIVLFYLIANQDEYCYQEIWEKASLLGVKTIPLLTNGTPDKSWTGLSGYLTPEVVIKHVPSYLERFYYLSGPPALVENYSGMLTKLKISRRAIITDHFSGY